ncbi:type VI protein secretion system component Hcp [Paraburkholderia sp. WSM4179]|nr:MULTISPECIES: type VI secretion system tube protein Hcp [Paraburkholderia]MDH6151856.1 type VI protein secretion system component Hcp [Paraburkholderia sp. WSM4179]
MGIPAHMWLKDDGGADIKGSSIVQDREGSIELISFGHGVSLPVDNANGRITGARIRGDHEAMAALSTNKAHSER